MRLILFGATGMVGAGVLRVALEASDVEAVLSVGRKPCGVEHPKLRELLLPDLFDFSGVEDQMTGWDACIWAIGVSSIGMDEAGYAKITEELTLKWAHALLRLNPGMSFCYCSGSGAGGNSMWARVRQRVEGALKTMGFQHVGVVRPAFIRPAKGIWSRVKLYNVFIVLMTPLFPVLVRLTPSIATTSERLARAMLRIVRGDADCYVLESADINRIGK